MIAHDPFRGSSVLVTGGLGFLGSNLARRLVRLGARVTLVDALLEGFGGSLANVAEIRDDVEVRIADLRDTATVEAAVRDQDYIFNLAGQVSHGDSMRDPQLDLALNCLATVNLLEACRNHNPRARLLYTSTRQVYGRPRRLPVNEDHPTLPVDANGINKLAAEHYHLLYDATYGICSTVLRLTNTFGPRQQIKNNRQGFATVFLRQALRGETISLYGGGSQIRDFNYVDDVVAAMLAAITSEACRGRCFNLGAAAFALAGRVRRRLAEVLRVSRRRGPLPRGAEADRHRRLRGGLFSVSRGDRLAAARRARRRTRTDRGVLPPAQGRLLAMSGNLTSGAADPSIRAFDCVEQYFGIRKEILRAIEGVLESGSLVLGPQVEAFERDFARYLAGGGHGVGVGNGTDALAIALRAVGVRPGDEVITVANTAVATASAIRMCGATPVFCDIDPDTLLMDLASAEACVSERTEAIVPVHLFGGAVDMPSVMRLAARHGLAVVEDCAVVRHDVERPDDRYVWRRRLLLVLPDQEPRSLRRWRAVLHARQKPGRNHASVAGLRLRAAWELSPRGSQQPLGRVASGRARRQATPSRRLAGPAPSRWGGCTANCSLRRSTGRAGRAKSMRATTCMSWLSTSARRSSLGWLPRESATAFTIRCPSIAWRVLPFSTTRRVRWA